MSTPVRMRTAGAVLATLAGVGVWSVGAASAAEPRGEGTMQVKQTTDCSGNGNESTVTVPFSVYFTGFEPGVSGTVTAYTQPGGEQVGERTLVIGPDGTRCARVTGDVPPGQYKLVYDFGSGTGKQKVIRIEGGSTPTPTNTATATSTATATDTATSSANASATTSTSTSTGRLIFTPLPFTADAGGDELAATGTSGLITTGSYAVLLIALGALAMVVTRRVRHDAGRAD